MHYSHILTQMDYSHSLTSVFSTYQWYAEYKVFGTYKTYFTRQQQRQQNSNHNLKWECCSLRQRIFILSSIQASNSTDRKSHGAPLQEGVPMWGGHCPFELVDFWSRGIIKKCEGLPLAIMTIGDLLPTKLRKGCLKVVQISW